jgi:hypothetical protein
LFKKHVIWHNAGSLIIENRPFAIIRRQILVYIIGIKNVTIDSAKCDCRTAEVTWPIRTVWE